MGLYGDARQRQQPDTSRTRQRTSDQPIFQLVIAFLVTQLAVAFFVTTQKQSTQYKLYALSNSSDKTIGKKNQFRHLKQTSKNYSLPHSVKRVRRSSSSLERISEFFVKLLWLFGFRISGSIREELVGWIFLHLGSLQVRRWTNRPSIRQSIHNHTHSPRRRDTFRKRSGWKTRSLISYRVGPTRPNSP